MDKACHAYQYKRTARTETLFARPGTAYLYLIYGMYHCLNFVTEAEGGALRGVDRGAVPVENKDIIAENRFGRKEKELTAAQRRNFLNGPGKLCGGWPSPGQRMGWTCWSRPLCLSRTGARAGADPDRAKDRDRLCPGGCGVSLALLVPAGGGGGPCCFLIWTGPCWTPTGSGWTSTLSFWGVMGSSRCRRTIRSM